MKGKEQAAHQRRRGMIAETKRELYEAKLRQERMKKPEFTRQARADRRKFLTGMGLLVGAVVSTEFQNIWDDLPDIEVFIHEIGSERYQFNYERIDWPGSPNILPRSFTKEVWPSVVRWQELANVLGKKYSLDPKLLLAIWWVESNGLHERLGQEVVSRCGAVGLGQVMPRDDPHNLMDSCGVDMTIFRNRPSTAALNNPIINGEASAQILRGNLDYHHGDIAKAVIGYGPRNIGDEYWQIVNFVYTHINPR